MNICIIIPCYNEFDRFQKDDFLSYFEKNEHVFFCLVNDGSSDNTIGMLKDLQKGRETRLNVLDLVENQGKAEAVRRGIIEAISWKKFDFVGFFDADFATPLSEIDNFIKTIKEHPDVRFMLGARIQRLGSKIRRTHKRHYFGRVFATCASIILKLAVYDTQCGAKLIGVELANVIFQEKFISKWLFDIELLFRTINYCGRKETERLTFELPLTQWEEIGGSKIKMTYLFKVPFELLKIRKHYKRKTTIIK